MEQVHLIKVFLVEQVMVMVITHLMQVVVEEQVQDQPQIQQVIM